VLDSAGLSPAGSAAEPHDGEETIGYVHSAEYGYTVGACVAYTYLPPEYAEPGTELEVLYEGERYAATVREEPLVS
jgi:aminomethyltransferase